MKLINNSKSLICLPLAFSCVALVTGCHHTSKEQAEYDAGYYMGATTATSSEWSGAATSSEAPATGQAEQVIPLYEEQLAVGTRQVDSGAVRLRKHVTTQPVSQTVQVRRETLVVDRQPGGGEAMEAGAKAFEPSEITIKLQTEEPVVEKRIVSSGKIVAQKRATSEAMTVQREVRRENISVEKIGDPQNVIISEGVSTEAVGAAPAEPKQIQGQGQGDQGRGVTTEEIIIEPFPRPQPDGKETFPALDKNPERP